MSVEKIHSVWSNLEESFKKSPVKTKKEYLFSLVSVKDGEIKGLGNLKLVLQKESGNPLVSEVTSILDKIARNQQEFLSYRNQNLDHFIETLGNRKSIMSESDFDSGFSMITQVPVPRTSDPIKLFMGKNALVEYFDGERLHIPSNSTQFCVVHSKRVSKRFELRSGKKDTIERKAALALNELLQNPKDITHFMVFVDKSCCTVSGKGYLTPLWPSALSVTKKGKLYERVILTSGQRKLPVYVV